MVIPKHKHKKRHSIYKITIAPYIIETLVGLARYNDHHFHYGYWCYAAAAAADLDPQFLKVTSDSATTSVSSPQKSSTSSPQLSPPPPPSTSKTSRQPSISNPSQECSSNTGCSALGLVGACCPTTEGVVLGCCESNDNIEALRKRGLDGSASASRDVSRAEADFDNRRHPDTLDDRRLRALFALASDIATPLAKGLKKGAGKSDSSTRFLNAAFPYAFPVARHKDFFDGHSWASGLFPMANGKSQESVSEAVNAYYGVALLGRALADRLAAATTMQGSDSIPKGSHAAGAWAQANTWRDLGDWSRLLTAMEIDAAHRYWQVRRLSFLLSLHSRRALPALA